MPGYRLKDRNRPLPNGVSCIDAHTGYKAPAFASFRAQVQGVYNARIGNPALVKRFHLSTKMEDIEDFVDQQLGRVAFDHGWTDFYIKASDAVDPILDPSSQGGAATPFIERKDGAGRVARAGAGIKTLAEMVGPEGPVSKEQAEKRAPVCIACPMHETNQDKGDWITNAFTLPAANAVRRMIGWIKDSKLETQYDSELRVCGACGCPTATKIWAQLPHILKHMAQEDKDNLPGNCWIKRVDN